MSNEIKYANVEILNDIQITELQLLFVGFKRFINNFTKDAFSGEPMTVWEVILVQEKLAEMIECLAKLVNAVMKIDEGNELLLTL